MVLIYLIRMSAVHMEHIKNCFIEEINHKWAFGTLVWRCCLIYFGCGLDFRVTSEESSTHGAWCAGVNGPFEFHISDGGLGDGKHQLGDGGRARHTWLSNSMEPPTVSISHDGDLNFMSFWISSGLEEEQGSHSPLVTQPSLSAAGRLGRFTIWKDIAPEFIGGYILKEGGEVC